MRKLIYFLTFFPLAGMAQVGIGTTDPRTTLDVNGAITNRELSFSVVSNTANINLETSLANLTGAATASINVTSFVPTVNGYRLIVSNTSTGGFDAVFAGMTIPNGQAMEYIYTNGLWKTTSGGVANNIYNTNGTLSGNRTVTQGGSSLSFTNTSVNGFNVDATTFSVDGLNDRIGIGATDPQQKLDVNGNIRIRSNNTIYYGIIPDYRLAIREDFESVVTGWTNNTRTTVLGQNILGGYNTSSTATNQKTFDLTGVPHTTVKIKFSYYAIDSWDTEIAYVRIPGTGGAWQRTTIYNEISRENIVGAGFADGIYYGEIEVPHTGNNLTIFVGSTLNQTPDDESYGIDNIEIWAR